MFGLQNNDEHFTPEHMLTDKDGTKKKNKLPQTELLSEILKAFCTDYLKENQLE